MTTLREGKFLLKVSTDADENLTIEVQTPQTYDQYEKEMAGDESLPFKVIDGFSNFRRDIRRLLYEYGKVLSNPGWTEAEIVHSLRELLDKANRRDDDNQPS